MMRSLLPLLLLLSLRRRGQRCMRTTATRPPRLLAAWPSLLLMPPLPGATTPRVLPPPLLRAGLLAP